MDKEYFTQLTNDLYQLTLLFPKKEPLRNKMRELGSNILTHLVMLLEGNEKECLELVHEIKKGIEPLDSFFELAKGQNWVTVSDIVDIQRKYLVIKEEIEKFEKHVKETVVVKDERVAVPNPETPIQLSIRQKKIINLLQEREKIQVSDVQNALPDITKRTIRRDFEYLVQGGFVRRTGKANLTFYELADKEI